ncbi:DALR anticodon-binding domain-containing protein 3 [Arctopsyche grandis]|uniref:DALR anticodon-binding domain-containing protein 3 n=1 Tax=Arctopsyche grandis TaxID=121162 RepID=UPI00406D9070
MAAVDGFVNKLYSYLTNKENAVHNGALIKRHNDKFERHGEFSFPWKINAWLKHVVWPPDIECSLDCTIFNITSQSVDSVLLEDGCKRIMENSRKWPLNIKKCVVVGDRLHIFLDRISCMRACLVDMKFDTELSCSEHQHKVRFSVDDGVSSDITHFRLELIGKVSEKLAVLAGYSISSVTDDKDVLNIHFTTKSHKTQEAIQVVCAPVLNEKSGIKECVVTTEQYLEKRTLDMKLKAQHKCRIYITDEEIWNESLTTLGEASAKFDLLQIKPTHSVLIGMSNDGSGCSKGASFILYNCARLSSIINTFRENITKGVYPELPDIKDVDFELLDDEDEWFMLFNYIFTYNSMLRKCIDIKPNRCTILPHQLCSFLSSFVVRFSMYYRKVRVLLKPRDHLIPKIYARIHLLMIIQKILHHGLTVLDMKLLSEM